MYYLKIPVTRKIYLEHIDILYIYTQRIRYIAHPMYVTVTMNRNHIKLIMITDVHLSHDFLESLFISVRSHHVSV